MGRARFSYQRLFFDANKHFYSVLNHVSNVRCCFSDEWSTVGKISQQYVNLVYIRLHLIGGQCNK